MARIIEFEGRQIEVPDDATDDEVADILSAQPAAPPAVPENAAVPGGVPGGVPGAPAAPKQGLVDYIDDTAAIGLDSAVGGAADLLGLPVDLINNAPRLLNLLPGVDGVGPMSPKPFLGSESIEDLIGAPADLARAALGRDKLEPQDMTQRIVGRIGREVGATAVPVAGALGAAARTGVAGARELNPLARYFVEPAAVAPGALVGRETAYAVGAGGGAGIANEFAGNPQEGDNFWSDFLGSLGGAAITAGGLGALGAGRNAVGAIANKPGMMDNVAGEEVVDRIINNSTDMGAQFAETGRVDTTPLAARLRTPSRVEDAVPGYRANIGDRSGDPLLMTMVQNQDMRTPGAANTRRVGNEAAVTQRIGEVAPDGDPALFRSAVEAGRDARLAEVLSAEDEARAIFGEAVDAVQPRTPDATARGSLLRSGLQDAADAADRRVAEAFAPINEARIEVPIAPLAERFGRTVDDLPLNDRSRFLPAEANVPNRLIPAGPDGAPVPDANVPLREITSVRSGLADDIRTAGAQGNRQQARIARKFRDETDEFLDAVMPEDLRQKYDAARDLRRDFGDRFGRSGDAIAETLRRRDGGDYRLDDSAVAGRFNQPDQGNLNDLRALLREAGQDPRVRGALADEVLSDIQQRNLVDNPARLARYMEDRGVLLEQFPELRQRLNRARAASDYKKGVEAASTATQARLNTPGRSPEASYLKFDNEATVDAVRNLVSGPKPRESAKALIEAAGNTPEARANARSALWEAVKTKKMSAPGATGEQRWDYKNLKSFFDDPKVAAVADELWSDQPEHLANIKELFSALATSEGSIRTRAPGSSGTPQALSGKLDPSMSTTGIASRARSVSRNQLSPTIAIVDVASTWLRNRSKKVQGAAIDELASKAFNDPDLAAALLEKFNPADAGARIRMITQKFGLRLPQLANALDEDDDEISAVFEDEDEEVMTPRPGLQARVRPGNVN